MSFAEGMASALNSYFKYSSLIDQQKQDKEDRAWQKMMRDRQMEQFGMETAIDNELKAVPAELAAKKNNVGGQALDENFVRTALPRMDPMAQQELTGALKGIKDPRQLAEAVNAYQQHYGGVQQPQVAGVKAPTAQAPQPQVPSLRAYKGEDGNMYMTADPEKYKPTQSEIMVEQARRLASGKFGQMGMKQGVELMNQARETMKMEQDMAFEQAMNAPTFAERVDGLVGILNGHGMIPGESKITRGEDGKVQLVHTVPGREKPHVTTLKGDSPEEILSDLALKVRARSNPDLLLRIQDREMQKMYRQEDRADRQAERDAERAHEDRMFGLQERKFGHDVSMDNKRYGLQAAAYADDKAANAAARAAAAREAKMTPEQKIQIDAQRIMAAGLAKTPQEAVQLAHRRALGIKFDTEGGGPDVPKDVEHARKGFRDWYANEGAGAPEIEVARRARIAGLNPAEFGVRTAPDPAAVAAAVKANKKPAASPTKKPAGKEASYTEKLKRATAIAFDNGPTAEDKKMSAAAAKKRAELRKKLGL